MESFTGAELAAMISPGCILGTDEAMSLQLDRQKEEMLNPRGRAAAPMRAQAAARTLDHWIRSVYLITAVVEDDGMVKVPLPSRAAKEALSRQLGNSGGPLTVQGRQMKVMKWEETYLLLAPVDGVQANCGNDHIVAVNLARPLAAAPRQKDVDEAIQKARARCGHQLQVEITHFVGGPCEDDAIMTCIVPGGNGCGWTVVEDLADAMVLAQSRAERLSDAQGSIHGSQTVRLEKYPSSPDLVGALGVATDFDKESCTWRVLLGNGDAVLAAPSDLKPLEGPTGRVFAFWGDARWSRTQLLGEIARGHWGLCRGSVLDIIEQPARRWPSLEGRLAFAPVTEMTENSLEEARQQMTVYRNTGLTGEVANAD